MEWNIIVGLVCTVLGAVISYATFSHNKGKDDRSNGQQLGTVLTEEAGYIKSNTDEIKTEHCRRTAQDQHRGGGPSGCRGGQRQVRTPPH